MPMCLWRPSFQMRALQGQVLPLLSPGNPASELHQAHRMRGVHCQVAVIQSR